MKIDYSDIRKEHKNIIKPIFNSMIHKFPTWIDCVYVQYDPDNEGGASAQPYKPYKRTVIRISRELFASKTSELERFVAHEIAHCYNEGLLRVIFEYLPLLSLEDDTKKVFHKACLDAIEYQTEDLCRLFCL